ncbi:hypothetical protein C9374_004752 [Naegleria lovaniensis]|uniref:Uncharacterized protein n=1 Tax=Naegleria lovaniensis TaxID=51637 RepID=A0AA88GRJ1_NAELO|nr:uncharacterized protein C9374_013608 [Naegleria lovaniensis]XP_044543010.1 uncharacterized protein C9374_011721 [Naegleria lovaniensis]XP_044548464.1 uncharacterized protein C9374_004752 [Naegleria lovaniensis]KAG2372707.1 hypothetical protein C9374_013608 [Naegleria lovaniensis]KAG2373836.1 hypothetical protein C9374_011721 [Naegleria lovaniensis]KAG2382785.1 hypothetical protein C9374_004752 [Naegleria lovaniensis]
MKQFGLKRQTVEGSSSIVNSKYNHEPNYEPVNKFRKTVAHCIDDDSLLDIGGIDINYSSQNHTVENQQCNCSAEGLENLCSGSHDSSPTNENNPSNAQSEQDDLLQFFREYWSDGDDGILDEEVLSSHSFSSVVNDNVNVNVDTLMKKILKFAVTSSLSENCLKMVLNLIREAIQLIHESDKQELSDKLTLTGFYKYFLLSSKTKKIPMCTHCQTYQKNPDQKSCPKCGKLWKDIKTHCFLRPLKFQFEERIFREPQFLDQFKLDNRDPQLIQDRCDGDIYKNIHKKFVDEGGKTMTLFGDGVAPFKSSQQSFYEFSVTFNEMKPNVRKKRKNNFLWLLFPNKPSQEEINLCLKIMMDDLNVFNDQFKQISLRLERVIADLPARSEILLFQKSGYYFCHLCEIRGEPVQLPGGTTQVRYPLRRDISSNQRIVFGLRDRHFWNNISGKELSWGVRGYSPILDQSWKPTPTTICSYDSMHNLYEGIMRDMMEMIPLQYWDEFDKEYLKQKFPSFLHRHPRSVSKNLVHLKAMEIYMIIHYYLDLLQDVKNFSMIELKYKIIKRMVVVIDKLTDAINIADLNSINEELRGILEDYQEMVGIAKATMNFHVASDMVRNAGLYGPLAHNTAFVGENLNFTLTKPFISSNSARYSIMFFDMAQLCDIFGLSELKPSECVCGHFVLKKERDVVADTSCTPAKYFKIKSFTDSTVTLQNLSDRSVIEVSNKEPLVPCVTVTRKGKSYFIPMHKNVNQYI